MLLQKLLIAGDINRNVVLVRGSLVMVQTTDCSALVTFAAEDKTFLLTSSVIWVDAVEGASGTATACKTSCFKQGVYKFSPSNFPRNFMQIPGDFHKHFIQQISRIPRSCKHPENLNISGWGIARSMLCATKPAWANWLTLVYQENGL